MKRVIATTLLIALGAGCAADSPVPPTGGPQITATPAASVTPAPSSAPEVATGFLYSCGSHAFDPAIFDVPGQAERDPHPASAALRQFFEEPNPEAGMLPDTGWYLAGRDGRRASFVAPVAGDPPFAHAGVELGPEGWRVVGWGQCRPTVAIDGLGAATWVLDPTEPAPGPESTSFAALVTEMACASARAADDRIQPPEVVSTPDVVLVTFGVRPLGGAQSCPGNPSTRIIVELHEPLGERLLLDGSVLPAHDPSEPWPPP